MKILSDSKSKLYHYLYGNGMPSIKLFKSARFLDPNQFKNLTQDIAEYSVHIKGLEECQEDWIIYCNIVKECSLCDNVVDFWNVNKKRLRKLYKIAEWLLYFTTNIAECERSISKYNNILTEIRKGFTHTSIINLNFVNFNKKSEFKK
ncbi:unnamed protein product [Brachionus calyciflorus]|uniref:HAT C-terminal dimerisation domain-containing protein n=1 Tax=Brachionus calyciflorus TaxID=104777 RepID=A0A814CH07_9BILA|nr:unnamed protein product [Brachionus calyciflorus]